MPLTEQRSLERSHGVAFTLLGLLLIVNALFLSSNAFRTLDFFNMGGFLDAGWRVFLGQEPYRDFFFHTGPLHLYAHAFFFHLFGFGKSAILAYLITASTVVIALTFAMTYRRIPLPLALAVTLLSMTCFNWPMSHPWYDHTAHLWGILVIAILSRQIPLRTARQAWWTGGISGLGVVLAFMTKSNIGIAYGLCFLAVFLSSPERRRAVSGYGFGLLAMGSLFLFFVIGSPRDFVDQTILSYGMNALRRFEKLADPRAVVYLAAYVTIIGIVMAPMRHQWRTRRERIMLFLGSLFAGIFSTGTSGILARTNIPAMGVSMALAFIILYPQRSEPSDGYERKGPYPLMKGTLCAATLALALLSGVYGYRLEAWTFGGKNIAGNYVLQTSPLEGWRCKENKGRAFDAMARFIDEDIPKDENLLILTDMILLYAVTGRDSFRGVPFHFLSYSSKHHGASPPPGMHSERTKQRILDRLPDWILTRTTDPGDQTYREIDSEIAEHYTPAANFSDYTFFRQKSI